MSATVAVWAREPDVPVKVMVGEAEATVIAAVRVMVAGCAGVSVRVDGVAVTPEGRPEMEMEIEPLKEFIGAAVIVIGLLVVPAFSDSEPGDTVSEKSASGLGAGLPQVASREAIVSAAMDPSALAKERMKRRLDKSYCTAKEMRRCHRDVMYWKCA